MNTELIQKKLQSFSKGSETSKIDYKKIFWSPPIGESTIRIVPEKNNPEYPFTELQFHSRKLDYPRLALTNFGEKDPIVDFIEELKNQKGEDGKVPKESWSIIGKIRPRPRYLVKVVVRGEEDLGVRIWTVNETNYKRLLTWATKADVGDYTDVEEGRDITVTRTKVMRGSQESTNTSIELSMSTSQLHSNGKKVKEWLTNQPEPLESYRKCDYDYLKQKLQEWLEPEHEDAKQNTNDVPTVNPTKEKTYSESKTVGKAHKKASRSEEFENNFQDLSKEILSSDIEDEEDDLPF